MTHTPGPWYVDGRMVAVNPIVSICAMVDFDSFGGDYPAANWEANARLIAAAPDLLAALDWALAEIEGRTRYNPDYYEASEQRENCMKKAVSALAKAEGRQ